MKARIPRGLITTLVHYEDMRQEDLMRWANRGPGVLQAWAAASGYAAVELKPEVYGARLRLKTPRAEGRP